MNTRLLVYLYKSGETREILQLNMREDIIKAAFGPEHWNNQENCYIFTIDKYNEFLKLIKVV